MRPGNAPHNLSDGGPMNAIFYGKIGHGDAPGIILSTNGANGVLGEFRLAAMTAVGYGFWVQARPVTISSRPLFGMSERPISVASCHPIWMKGRAVSLPRRRSPLLRHVSHVVRLRAKEQVRWVDTSPNVAFVAGVHVVRDGAKGGFIGETMGWNRVSMVYRKGSVSPAEARGPKPTRIRPCRLVNVLPEAQFWCDQERLVVAGQRAELSGAYPVGYDKRSAALLADTCFHTTSSQKETPSATWQSLSRRRLWPWGSGTKILPRKPFHLDDPIIPQRGRAV